MCTFKNNRSVTVCDVAIAHVRQAVDATFPEGISYTVIDGEGTLVEASPTVDPDAFQSHTRAAIEAAQQTR